MKIKTDFFERAGIEIDEFQLSQLEKLTDFMLEYNKNVNLTRITEPDEIAEKHYTDSVLPLKLTVFPENASIIDVGTGAGFPALPMKIMRGDLQFTLLESLNKRITYLEQACQLLGVQCKAVHARSEDAAKDARFREKFDIATARAVANLPALCEYCLPFVKVGGKFIALKGADSEAEIAKNAIALLGGKISEIISYELPSGDKRNLIVIDKVAATPAKYPRSAVNIAKKPLI